MLSEDRRLPFIRFLKVSPLPASQKGEKVKGGGDADEREVRIMRHKNWREILAARLQILGSHSYRDYLRSEHWQSVRARFYASKLYTGGCHCCFATNKPLEIHHKSYKRLGCERLNDLIAVCRDCHQQTHALVGETTRRNIWNSWRKVRRRNASKL